MTTAWILILTTILTAGSARAIPSGDSSIDSYIRRVMMLCERARQTCEKHRESLACRRGERRCERLVTKIPVAPGMTPPTFLPPPIQIRDQP